MVILTQISTDPKNNSITITIDSNTLKNFGVACVGCALVWVGIKGFQWLMTPESSSSVAVVDCGVGESHVQMVDKAVEVNNTMLGIERSLDGKISDVYTSIDGLTEKLESTQSTLENLEKKHEALRQSFDVLQQNVNPVTANLGAVDAVAVNMASNAETVNTVVSHVQSIT